MKKLKIKSRGFLLEATDVSAWTVFVAGFLLCIWGIAVFFRFV